MGSGAVIQTLMHENLIDEYLLFDRIHSSSGDGCCCCERERSASLRLIESTTTETGVVIARIRNSSVSCCSRLSASDNTVEPGARSPPYGEMSLQLCHGQIVERLLRVFPASLWQS